MGENNERKAWENNEWIGELFRTKIKLFLSKVEIFIENNETLIENNVLLRK